MTTTHALTAPYALDALDPVDERAFEQHLQRCPDCREQLDSFSVAVAALAYDAADVEPPPRLSERILAATRTPRIGPVHPLGRRRAPAPFQLAAVAACAAVGLGIWTLMLSRSLDRERSARRAEAPVLRLLGGREVRLSALSGRGGTLLTAPGGEAALVVSDLGRAPAGRTYEAWVVIDGRPRPAGIFPGGSGRSFLRLTRPVPRGAVVGVSKERAGGSRTPTGPMLFTTRAA